MVGQGIVLALMALIFHQGEAIRCYVCSSERDATCRDPFNKDQSYHKLTECNRDSMTNIHELLPGIFSNFGSYYGSQPEDFVCVKAVTREHDREKVVRSCSIPRQDTFDVCSQLKSRSLHYCQSCKGDSCNGVQGLAPVALLFGILPVILSIL